ncbi:PH domain-containing protein [Candidatus Micrarchaeota archaeon]|nr:PH domain-containing protein [Candidatus Micrarchaeota archaeon]
MKELEKVLDEDEKVLWEGKPEFWPFFLGGSIWISLFGLIWLLFISPVFLLGFADPEDSSIALIFMIPFLLIGLGLVFGTPLYNLFVHKHIYYAITDKRIIIQHGIIGRDFEILDFDQVTNAQVNVDLFDQIFGGKTGSILTSCAGIAGYTKNGTPITKSYNLANIQDPYEVFKFFKKVSHDVKTDIQYPNKLRPSENPGYKTDYKPPKKMRKSEGKNKENK